jgi:putative transposase
MTLVNELGDPFGVEPILRIIGVATSTFYGWLKQAAEPSQRRRDDAVLVADIGRIHERSGQNPSATPAPDLVNRQSPPVTAATTP